MSPEQGAGSRAGANAWLDRFLSAYYVHRPVSATFIGRHEHDHRLPDYSESGIAATVGEMEELLGSAPAADDLDVRLATGYLRTQLWEFQSGHGPRGNPALATGEAVFGIMGLFLTDYAPMADRVAAAVARLEAIPGFLEGARATLRRAPSPWIERALDECAGAEAFLGDGIARLSAEHRITTPALGAAAARARAAFAEHDAFLRTDLAAREPGAAGAGEEAYRLHLREAHCIDEAPDEIARYAEEELGRTRGILARTPRPGPDGHAATADYYRRYQAIWDRARDAAVAQELLTWPDFPIRYVPRPAWARTAAPHLYFLFYRAPAAFQRPAVHHYLVTPVEPAMPQALQEELLVANDDCAITLNHVVHHGGIGHHVQNWHAYRCASRIGRIAAVDCASRIALLCGGTMAEGWACYATDLMDEAGLLTPFQRYDELRTRLRMCARAVVDVRLHQGRFTPEQAAGYYQREAEMSAAGARGEVTRNSMFPGTAVMYVLGRDAIHQLRRDLSARLGPRFRLRAFHDEFLSYGSIPVRLIGDAMRKRVTHAG